MAENKVIELQYTSRPSNGGAVVKALFSGRPPQAADDKLDVHYRATWLGARADRAGLAKYRALVGLANDGILPAMYPHAMAMPLHLSMFTHDTFPLRVMGLLHFTNSIESLRPIRDDEAVDVFATIDGIDKTERGQAFDVVTVMKVGDEIVWRETSNFLSALPPSARTKSGKPAQPAETPDWGEPMATWKVAADAGRKFAGPANDVNPIHMAAFTAKLFGFRSAIAHGMFSAARCLALLQKDHPIDGRFGVDVRFKKPLFIPGQVALHTVADGDATRFLLKVQPKGEPHIEGRVYPIHG